MFPVRHPRFAFAATLVAAFTLLLILAPTVGAEERRDRRDASDEKTPTPIVLEADPVEPPPEATSQDDDAVLVAETGVQETSPEGCEQEGWEPAEPPLNPDLGCLPQSASGGSSGGSGGGDATVDVAPATATLVLPPKPEEHPGHCPEGYAWELLLQQDERGNLTWLYGCVPDGSLDPGGPDDATGGSGGAEHPGHGCPEGYVLKLLLRQNADGSLTWLYGCVPDGSGPVGPGAESGTGGDGGGGDSPRIDPIDDITAGGGGREGGGDSCPDGHYWTDGPIYFPNWPVDTNGDGYFDTTDTVVVYGGCVPDGGECPEGSAIHPGYTEYGCIKYGYGPWAT